MSSSKPIRAQALPDNDIGKKRYKLFTSVLERIKQARENGYYLEAIALIESLISDRLEKYLSSIEGENVEFSTLGKLIGKSGLGKYKDEIDDDLKNIIFNEVNVWKDKRNKSLHEMAKIAVDNQETWQEKCEDLSKIADEGLAIFRKIDRALKQ